MEMRQALAATGDEADNLVYSPTWAVACTCFVFIVCSLIVERSIFAIGKVWRSRKQIALLEALEKIKEELMLVGFISLALTVGQRHVAKICVPEEWTHVMRQCKRPKQLEEGQHFEIKAAATPIPGESCTDKGKADFIHLESLHQLHILIFALAVVHVVYSVFIMVLGMWKVHRWRGWEEMSGETEIASLHAGMRYAKETTFIKRHAAAGWRRNRFFSLFAAFFQQFYQAVSCTDYLTLRHGFIEKHNLPTNYDFHKYIMTSLEVDFKHVVGISTPLWGYLVLLILVNVEGWGTLYWAALLPFIIVLVIGTKLRHIITQMAIGCLEKHAVIEGVPSVKPSDDLFWFKRPRLILSLIHFILFQNAIELSLHLWSTFTFTKTNCFNYRHYLLAGRLILGLISQVLCGYVVLPIYALVSQMGSQLKEHHNLELGFLGSHEKGGGSTSRQPVQEEGIIPVEASSVNQLQRGGDDFVGVTTDNHGDSDATLQRQMSYMERVARGVQGESYYKLHPARPSGQASV